MKRLCGQLFLILSTLLFLAPMRPVFADEVVLFKGNGVSPGDRTLTSQRLKAIDLQKMSLVDLTLLRDGIYARHGHRSFRVDWVAAYFQHQKWYVASHTVHFEDLNPTERANVLLIEDVEDSFSMADLRVRSDRIFTGDEIPDNENKELYVLPYTDRTEYQMLQRFINRAASSTRVPVGQRLDVSQLRKIPVQNLTLMRNEIFARRGRPFETLRLLTYYRSRGYEPDAGFTNARLTPLDWYNVQAIQQVETEKGGAQALDDGR